MAARKTDIQQVAAGLTSVQRLREADRRKLKRRIEEAGGFEEWVPLVASAAPPDLTLQDIERQTVVWYEHAERRLRACARCPAPELGPCADQTLIHKNGQRPEWDGRRLISRRCEFWNEAAVRRRLRDSGVPPRYAEEPTMRLRGSSIPDQHATQFAMDVRHHDDPWLIVEGWHHTGKTRLAVGVLAQLASRIALPDGRVYEPYNRHFVYLDVPDVRAALARHLHEMAPDPLDEARELPLVVFDGCHPSQQPQWMRDFIEQVFATRWKNKLATLITTNDTVADLGNAYPRAYEALESATRNERLVQLA